MDLERSVSPSEKLGSLEDEKRHELELNFSDERLERLVRVLRTSLDGPLGQLFYSERADFLVRVAFCVWRRYLKNQLQQMNFAWQQRLVGEFAV